MDLSAFTFEVRQANPTVHGVIREALEGAGAQVVEGPREGRADCLVMDAQGVPADRERLDAYTRQGRPVLICGFPFDHEAHASLGEWLTRPFSPRALIYACAQLMGVTGAAATSLPGAAELEAELGLAPGILSVARGDVDRTMSLDDLVEDASNLIVDIEEISELEVVEAIEIDDAPAGRVLGLPTVSALDRSIDLRTTRASATIDDSIDLRTTRVAAVDDSIDLRTTRVATVEEQPIDLRTTRAVSMDDPTSPHSSPHLLLPESTIADPRHPTQPERSGLRPRPTPDAEPQPDATVAELPVLHRQRQHTPSLTSTGALPALNPQGHLEITTFARMLAEAWPKLGLSARLDDRTSRLTSALTALLERGLDGATEALDRVPPAAGFSGSLEVLSLVGLFRTVRDRRLRGRLEVSASGQGGHVLYLDRHLLISIEALDGDEHQALLRILHAQGHLEHHLWRELRDEYARADSLSAPVELVLRQRHIVSPQAIEQAREAYARELFAQVCAIRTGTFAFIEVRDSSHHAWPGRQLKLNLDELLLALMREAEVPTEHSAATSHLPLAPDPARIAQVPPDRLTDDELEMLRFFQRGGTLEQARQRLPHAPGEVDRIVNRLKGAELLRRSDPMHQALDMDWPPKPSLGELGELGDEVTSEEQLPDDELFEHQPTWMATEDRALSVRAHDRADALDMTMSVELPATSRALLNMVAPRAERRDQEATVVAPLDDALERLERSLEVDLHELGIDDMPTGEHRLDETGTRPAQTALGGFIKLRDDSADVSSDDLDRLLRDAFDDDER